MPSAPLYDAALAGNPDDVRRLLAEGAEPGRTSRGSTPLHGAAAGGSAAVVELLLGAGADPSGRGPRGDVALHAAGSAEVVRLLVADGASVHAVDREGRAPLHTARDIGAARELLVAGADPHAVDHRGRTPLHTAAGAELIELLLAAGVPVDAPDRQGRTPLWHRTSSVVQYHERPQEGLRAVRALLAAGADPARRDSHGVAPIHNMRRNPSVLGEREEEAALRARMRVVAEAALGPGLRSRVSSERAAGMAQRAAAVHPRGTEAITATRDGVLVRWSLGPHAPRPVEVVATDRIPFTALARSPDGTLLALGGGEHQPVELRRWDRLDEVVAVLEDVHGSDCLSFSADGRLLAAGWWSPGGGEGLAVVDVAERRVLATEGRCRGVEALVFAPDGTLTVAWLDDAALLEDVRADLSDVGDEQGEYPHLACRAESLAFSRDGTRLAVCGPAPSDARTSDAEPGMIALHGTARRAPVWTVTVDARVKGALQRWHSPVTPRSVCFLAGDRQVAVGLLGGVLVLDAGTGEIVHSSTWWPEDVHTIHAVPGDAAVVVGAEDGFHRLPLPR